MCKKNLVSSVLALVLVGSAVTTVQAGADIFSVNLYSYQNLAANLYENVTLEADQSAGLGDWETKGWVNVVMPPSAQPVPLTSVGGQTATFTVASVRNAWRSRTLDGTRAAAVGDGNGDLFDVGGWGTEDQAKVLDMTVSDIPFGTYDVIVYLGHHPTAGGARTGVITFNETPMEITVTEGAFNGTFTQIVKAGDTGNYILYSNVKGPSFRIHLAGHGTNHQGICGFQFRQAAPQLAANSSPADGAVDVPRDHVVLSWTPGDYAAQHDIYFSGNFDDVNNATTTSAVYQGRQAEAAFDPGRLEFGTTYHWRVDEVNAPPDSTIFQGEVWSFTTEPIAYAVPGESIAVTASSADENQGPENTINGKGLANDLHSDDLTAMWLTAPDAEGPAWIQYEFNEVLRLHEMWVWNHNGLLEPTLGLGAKEVAIEYSVDGIDYTALEGPFEFSRASGKPGYAHNTTVNLGGIAARYVRLKINNNWRGILPQYGLSEVRFFSVPVFAREPNPVPGRANVDVTTDLTWRAGREAAKHNVYLSTDQQAVIDGTAPVATVTGTSYTPALNLAGTYYWKVVEVNEAQTPSAWAGPVWRFDTEAYDVVDDFESYTDEMDSDEAIFQTWVDGYEVEANGSLVGYGTAPFAERTIINSGRQSMPLAYDNTTAMYSEAKRTFTSPQDWSQHGIKGLTLRFYGKADNAAQQMYVKINNTKIPYDGDPEGLKRQGWQMWYIDLAGRNVGNVTSLSIGFDRLGATSGTGMVFIDDIRLYPLARQLTTPADPGTAGLQAQYQFEGNANDSSGKGRNGSLKGAPTFVAGKAGQALSLNGTADYVNLDGYKGVLADAAGVQQALTLCAWIKTATNGRDIIAWGTNAGGQRMNFRVDTVLRVEHGAGNILGSNGPRLIDDEWHHVAATVPQGGRIMDVLLYVDGANVTPASTTMAAFNLKPNIDVVIGQGGTQASRFFLGLIDEARIYDRALSSGEIAWLAGRTMPFDNPF